MSLQTNNFTDAKLANPNRSSNTLNAVFALDSDSYYHHASYCGIFKGRFSKLSTCLKSIVHQQLKKFFAVIGTLLFANTWNQHQFGFGLW